MCTLNEAGRKSICASVCDLCLLHKRHGLGTSSEIDATNRLVDEGKPLLDEARVMGMLRITIAETVTEQRWTLEGRLVQPWVSELKSNWARTGTARRERKCVVDLTGVTFIDKSGEKALATLFKEGAELIATGTYTQYVVRNIEKKKSNRQL